MNTMETSQNVPIQVTWRGREYSIDLSGRTSSPTGFERGDTAQAALDALQAKLPAPLSAGGSC
jgi:hypothetical protein